MQSPTPKVKAQTGYFEKCYLGLGREYGYVLSAMKKAFQAAGRPIRTLEGQKRHDFSRLPFCYDILSTFSSIMDS